MTMEEEGHAALGETSVRGGAWSFLLSYALIGSSFWLGLQGGWWTLLGPLLMTFALVPVVDQWVGLDLRNPPEQTGNAASALGFRLVLWAVLPARVVYVVWGALFVARPSSSAVEWLGAAISTGIMGGAMGITVAHEFVHRRSRAERAFGAFLLITVSYAHWAIEHVSGHHRHVATPADPATARLGEPLPTFLLRSLAGGYRSAWSIEAARHRSALQNRVFWSSALSVALTIAFALLLGVRAALFFVAQSLVAIALLETVNYIEHYGLERRLLPAGVYERVSVLHSWNASHRVTNLLLFNLQRHSDHHVYPYRPYHELRHHDESPQLPFGYATMALFALCPPLWHRLMDPLVASHRARLGQVGQVEDSAAR